MHFITGLIGLTLVAQVGAGELLRHKCAVCMFISGRITPYVKRRILADKYASLF